MTTTPPNKHHHYSTDNTAGEEPVERLLSRLDGVKRGGDRQWSARCPAHEDRNASLSVSVGDGGRALVKCHAGCKTEDIVAAVGLKMADLMPPRPPRRRKSSAGRRIDKIYDYCDEDGNLLFQVVRYEPKDFRQRRPDGRDGWTWNIKGVRVVPYRLSELIARPGEPVYVVEGEKDADALADAGLLATTSAGGGGQVEAGARRAADRPGRGDPARQRHAGAEACRRRRRVAGRCRLVGENPRPAESAREGGRVRLARRRRDGGTVDRVGRRRAGVDAWRCGRRRRRG